MLFGRETFERFHLPDFPEDTTPAPVGFRFKAVDKQTGQTVILAKLRANKTVCDHLQSLKTPNLQTILGVYDQHLHEGRSTATVAFAPLSGTPLTAALHDTLEPDDAIDIAYQLADTLEKAREPHAVSRQGWNHGKLHIERVVLRNSTPTVSLVDGLGKLSPKGCSPTSELDTFALGAMLWGILNDPKFLDIKPTDVLPNQAPWSEPPHDLGKLEHYWAIVHRALGGLIHNIARTPGDIKAALQHARFRQQFERNKTLHQAFGVLRHCLQDNDFISLGAFLDVHRELFERPTVLEYIHQNIGLELIEKLKTKQHFTCPEQALIVRLYGAPKAHYPPCHGQRTWYLNALAETAQTTLKKNSTIFPIGVYRFRKPDWWDTVEHVPIPDHFSNEPDMRTYARTMFGSDVGTPENWRTVLKYWATVCAQYDIFPVYLGHCYTVGGQLEHAAAIYADLYHLASTREDAAWVMCYTSCRAGRAFLKNKQPALARFWYNRCRALSHSKQFAKPFIHYIKEANTALRKLQNTETSNTLTIAQRTQP